MFAHKNRTQPYMFRTKSAKSVQFTIFSIITIFTFYRTLSSQTFYISINFRLFEIVYRNNLDFFSKYTNEQPHFILRKVKVQALDLRSVRLIVRLGGEGVGGLIPLLWRLHIWLYICKIIWKKSRIFEKTESTTNQF